MENEINFKEKFTKIFLVILFGGLFMQATYVFLNINLTMSLTIAIFIIWGINLIRYKIVNLSYLYVIISGIMISILIYSMKYFDASYIRVALNIALFGIIFYCTDVSIIRLYENKIRKIIYSYFIINIILYLSRNPKFFKNVAIEGSLRFKGLMPDANALASLCLFLMIIGIISFKENKKILPMILMLLLIFTTGSRGNTLVGISILAITLLKLNIIYKAIPIGIITYFMSSYIVNMNVFQRLLQIGLSLNNRNILSQIAFFEYNNSTLFEKITGVGMCDRYIFSTTNLYTLPYHDFAENSYITIIILFGIIGLILILSIILTMFLKINKKNFNIRSNIILILLLVILSKQDIILSTQLWMTMIVSVKVLSLK